MKKQIRIALRDGGWFDESSATKYDENTYWNGSNNISSATGSQWDHETLYITRNGRYILESWSQRQGDDDVYYEIDDKIAVEWLIRNGHEVPTALTEVANETEV